MAEETPEGAPEPTTTAPAPADTGKTFTQEQVNDLIAREKGKIQAKFEGFDDLKAKAAELDQIKEANASELEKAQSKTKKETERAETAEAKLLRYEVAQEKEIPAKLVPLLTATDKESLEAQADLIHENAKPENPDFDGGTRQPAPESKTPEEQHNQQLLQMLGLTQT